MKNIQEEYTKINNFIIDFLPIYKEILLTWVELEDNGEIIPYLIIIEFNKSVSEEQNVIEHRLRSKDNKINMYQVRFSIDQFQNLQKWLFIKESNFFDFEKHSILNQITFNSKSNLNQNMRGKPIHYYDIRYEIKDYNQSYNLNFDSEFIFLDLKTKHIYPTFRKVYENIFNAELIRAYHILYKIPDYRGSIDVRYAFGAIFIKFLPSPKYAIEKYALLIESESKNYYITLWGEDIDNPEGAGEFTNEILNLTLYWNLTPIQQMKIDMKEREPSEIGIIALYAAQDRIGISSLQENEIRILNNELYNIGIPKFDDIAEMYLDSFKIQNMEKRRIVLVNATILLEEFIKRIYLKNSISITGKGTLYNHISNPKGIFRNKKTWLNEINSCSTSYQDQQDFDMKWQLLLKNEENSVEANKICLVLLTRNLEQHRGGYLRIWTVSEDFHITLSSILAVLLLVFETSLYEGLL